MFEDTICAIATPHGTGGISVIRVSGTNAIDIVNKIFKGKNLKKAKSHTISYGHIVNEKEVIDEVLVSVFIAPKSFTGENTIEISTHGGILVTERVLEEVLAAGARLARPGELVKELI